MPDPTDVSVVLEFLRKNGFLEVESALKEDMIEKDDLGYFDYEKFMFPMVPRLLPVRIPASFQRSEVQGGKECLGSSSVVDDEFVSAGSSTSTKCSSEFTNPYGVRSTSLSVSQASSDRFSQLGTACDYHDVDMQNDLFWHDEKDDGDFMTPCLERSDLFTCPIEDKNPAVLLQNHLAPLHVIDLFPVHLGLGARRQPITKLVSYDTADGFYWRSRRAKQAAGSTPTQEMINLLSALQKDRFAPRFYIAAAIDNLSLQKIRLLEENADESSSSQFMQIYRSREVGLSYFTSVLTTLIALAHGL
ncbi:hypothetical protein ACFX2F_002852 [Malus domestica]